MNNYDKSFSAPVTGIEWMISRLSVFTKVSCKIKRLNAPSERFISLNFIVFVEPKEGTRTENELRSAEMLTQSKRFINYIKRILMDRIKQYDAGVEKIYFPQGDSFYIDNKISIRPVGQKLPSGFYTSEGSASGMVIVRTTCPDY